MWSKQRCEELWRAKSRRFGNLINMPTIPLEQIIESYAELADDFFCDLLLIKWQPITTESVISGSIPFLHAHALELSVKTMALNLDIDFRYVSGKKIWWHDIKSMYEKISETYPDILLLLPAQVNYSEAKLLYFNSNDVGTSLFIPNPQDANILELAFYIENVMNLKYWFTQDFVRLSWFMMHSNSVNPKFLALFKYCRDYYKNDVLNKRIQRRIISIAWNNDEVVRFINHLILW